MNDAELKELVKRAVAIVEGAAVPEDLRAAVFQQVWSTIVDPGSAPLIPAEMGQVVGDASTEVRPTSDVEQFAHKLGITVDEVEDAFRVEEDGSFSVDIATKNLPAQKRKATIDVALLVCAGRQYKSQEFTAGTLIRSVCDDYGRLDGPNFSATMSGRDDLWSIGGGTRGHPASYRLRRPAWPEAGDTVKRLLGS
jgi:hypothetical protein